MLFNLNRVAGELEHVVVCNAETLAVGLRYRHVLYAAAIVINHAQLLAAERPAQDNAATLAEGRLVDIEFVRVDCALDDVLAEPIDASDEHDVTKSGFGIQGKYDAACCAIRSHHFHHADRERDFEMIESIIDAIGNGAIGKN